MGKYEKVIKEIKKAITSARSEIVFDDYKEAKKFIQQAHDLHYSFLENGNDYAFDRYDRDLYITGCKIRDLRAAVLYLEDHKSYDEERKKAYRRVDQNWAFTTYITV